MPSPARCRFYTSVLIHLWGLPEAPAPQDLASWMAAQPFEDPPPDLPVLLKRLRAWPAGAAYPPLPDDEALKFGMAARPGWLVPGAAAHLTLPAPWLSR